MALPESQMPSHIKTHESSIKMFHCGVCISSFSTNQGLWNHKQSQIHKKNEKAGELQKQRKLKERVSENHELQGMHSENCMSFVESAVPPAIILGNERIVSPFEENVMHDKMVIPCGTYEEMEWTEDEDIDMQIERKIKAPLKGIINSANTCYLNVVMQSLRVIPE